MDLFELSLLIGPPWNDCQLCHVETRKDCGLLHCATNLKDVKSTEFKINTYT